MDRDDVLKIVKEYLKDNLTIETSVGNDSPGYEPYTIIEVKLDGETISTAYVD